MNPNEFDKRMRRGELFHSLRIGPGYPVLRLDGRAFHALTKPFKKPFDSSFNEMMVNTARALLRDLGGIYAFTQSDEISVLLPKDYQTFDRELEKLVSISASIAARAFQEFSKQPADFDSRVWVGGDVEEVSDYFRWRQADSERNALNGYAYWSVRQDGGASADQATRVLVGMSNSDKHDALMGFGINYNELPTWQKRGVGLQWSLIEKIGKNPLTGEEVMATRRRVVANYALPRSAEYGLFIRNLISQSETGVYEL